MHEGDFHQKEGPGPRQHKNKGRVNRLNNRGERSFKLVTLKREEKNVGGGKGGEDWGEMMEEGERGEKKNSDGKGGNYPIQVPWEKGGGGVYHNVGSKGGKGRRGKRESNQGESIIMSQEPSSV